MECRIIRYPEQRGGGLVTGGALKREASRGRRHVFMYLGAVFGVRNDLAKCEIYSFMQNSI